jgi:hypothetical protein
MNTKLISLLLLTVVSNSTHATLHNRGNGMIFDDLLNTTWLQDANHANTSAYVTENGRDVTTTNGKMTWDEAIGWTTQLNHAGFSDWRLPDVKPINGTHFQISVGFDGSTDFGEHITSPQTELPFMYYVNLNNLSVHDTSGNLIGCGSTGSCLVNTGIFNNFIPDNYWTDVEIDNIFAWSFNARHGIQTPFDGKANLFYAWAVRTGDVATVPLPAGLWLFSSALFCLITLNKKQHKFGFTQDLV